MAKDKNEETVTCQVCGGSGHWETDFGKIPAKDMTCGACNGTGRVPK